MKKKITLLTAILLCLGIFAGCDNENGTPESGAPENSAVIEPTGDIPPEPDHSEKPDDSDDNLARPEPYDWNEERTPSTMLRFTLEGMDEAVPAELFTGSFDDMGGPEWSMYVDTAVFTETTENGKSRYTTDSGNAYIEIGCIEDASADFEAPAFLEDFDNITLLTDENISYIGAEDYTARHVEAEGDNGFWTGYLIQRGDSVLTVAVFCSADTESADTITRVMAMLETLMLRNFEID